MSELPMALAAALFLVAAAIAPKSRTKLGDFFNIPQDFGTNLFNAGNGFSQTDSMDNATGNFALNEQAKPSGVNVLQLPKNRVLTEQEMFALCSYITEKFFRSMSPDELVTYAYVESSFRPWVERSESRGRKSVGLMQTLIGTAQEMYDKGYRELERPTESTLKNPIHSMYYGAAYIDWLRRNYTHKAQEYGNYEEYFVRAYNGGAGWQGSQGGREGTANYWSKWQKAYARFKKDIIGTGLYY